MALILSIDPGKTTGFVYWDSDSKFAGDGIPRVLWDYEGDTSHVWQTLTDAYRTDEIPILIVEKFNRPRGFGHADLTTVEVIGVIKEFARQHNLAIVWQDRSQKKFFTNERLKERGVYFKGMPHARDAARHLLYYLEFGEGKKLK